MGRCGSNQSGRVERDRKSSEGCRRLVRVLGGAGVGHSIVGGSHEEQGCSAGVLCAMSNVVSGFGGLVLVDSSFVEC